jgi:hypothetical protein
VCHRNEVGVVATVRSSVEGSVGGNVFFLDRDVEAFVTLGNCKVVCGKWRLSAAVSAGGGKGCGESGCFVMSIHALCVLPLVSRWLRF